MGTAIGGFFFSFSAQLLPPSDPLKQTNKQTKFYGSEKSLSFLSGNYPSSDKMNIIPSSFRNKIKIFLLYKEFCPIIT